MRIAIPTYGRGSNQVTFRSLPRSYQQDTVLLVDSREASSYGDFPHIVLPPEVNRIGLVRQWVLDNLDGKVAMMDDDLTFFARRDDDRTKFRTMELEDFEYMFADLEKVLDITPHAGIGSREGGNRNTNTADWNTRMVRVLAYNVPVVRGLGVRYDRVPVMEDFDVTLQLIRMGHANCVLQNWVTNQAMSGAAGGCSTYRTMEVQAEAAHKLAELHYPFVKVVTKQTKTAWNGQERTDVIIRWKDAFNES